MIDPKPMSEAPKDGTVVLSNEGPVRWSPYWNSPKEWVYCTSSGDPFYCADEGIHIATPSSWIPLPDWMRGLNQDGPHPIQFP